MKFKLTTPEKSDIELPTRHVIPGTRKGGVLTVDLATWQRIKRNTPSLPPLLAQNTVKVSVVWEDGDSDNSVAVAEAALLGSNVPIKPAKKPAEKMVQKPATTKAMKAAPENKGEAE